MTFSFCGWLNLFIGTVILSDFCFLLSEMIPLNLALNMCYVVSISVYMIQSFCSYPEFMYIQLYICFQFITRSIRRQASIWGEKKSSWAPARYKRVVIKLICFIFHQPLLELLVVNPICTVLLQSFSEQADTCCWLPEAQWFCCCCMLVVFSCQFDASEI